MTLTWDGIAARRLARHGLAAPVPADQLASLVATICGAHAQVMSAAEVSIGLRVAGITRTDVRAALWEERSLVKTFGPRGTVHILAATDLGAWNQVLGEALVQPNFPPDVRMDAEQTDAVVSAIGAALADRDLSADELGAAVVDRAGAWAGDLVMPAFQGFWPRWMQVLRTAAFRGALIFGPNRGARTTYTSPRRWLGEIDQPPPDEATRAILQRYLYAFGPTRPDFLARWLNTTPAWAKDAFRRAGDEVERVEVEGETLWQLAGDRDAPDGPTTGVRLLPYFDAFAVGCHPRERLYPGRAAERALARTQAGNIPVLVADGIVAGIWHQKRAGRKLDVTVEPFRPLTTRERRDLGGQVERIATIQETTARLTVGTVTVGPHA
jgi:hypothetical protein